jgi:archaellum component FlaC
MASGSKVTPTLTPDTSTNDESDDDIDDDNEAFLHEMGIVYASLWGNNDARAKVKHLMETLFEHKETIKELNSLVNEGKRRFNLLKQELSEEKHTNYCLSQSIKSYELTNTKSINDACATNSTSC